MPPLVLLTNDDGCNAAGLRALWRELEGSCETVVVAPAHPKSWIGKALTNSRTLTIETKQVDGKEIYVVEDGTPADCVNLGIYHVCATRYGRKPDVVLSGINNGANFTNSLVLASGTVGGALEAALQGVLGIAVSLDVDAATEVGLRQDFQPEHLDVFEPAARAVGVFLREWLARSDVAHVSLVNLILPQTVSEPLRFVECAPLPYEYGSVFEKRGNGYINRGRGFIESNVHIPENSDVGIVRQGMAAFTCYSGNLERIIL